MTLSTWTIMALSLGGEYAGHPPTAALVFPSYTQCSELINPMRAVFEAQGLDVVGVYCHETGVISASPFPKARPNL
jgi:hypothetical protein